MLTQHRRDLIMAEVRAHGAVRVVDLVAKFDVSGVTVRRDITALAGQGLVDRVHGGATLPHRRGLATADADSAHPERARFSLGMVVPSMDYYWPHVIRGAQLVSAQRGGRLAVRASGYDPAEERLQITRLLEAGVQGLLLAPSTDGRGGADLMRWIAALNVPTVLIERTVPGELPARALDSVTTDHAQGAAVAVRHLVGEGNRRIGLLTNAHSPHSAAIRHGWRMAASGLGIDADGCPDADMPSFGQPGWRDAVETYLDECLAKGTTGLLVYSDTEAVALLQCAEDHGIDVPGQLAVIAYDDEVASVTTPALTAVRPPKPFLGNAAVDMLLARMTERDRPIHRVQLLPELVLRESTRPQAGPGARG